MFNLLPGQGLGFSGSQALAFGLLALVVTTIVIPSSAGFIHRAKVYDNAYSKRNDEGELIELLTIILQVV